MKTLPKEAVPFHAYTPFDFLSNLSHARTLAFVMGAQRTGAGGRGQESTFLKGLGPFSESPGHCWRGKTPVGDF